MPAFEGMGDKDMFIESDLDPQLFDFNEKNKTLKRSKISVYVGKGIIRPLPISIYNSLGISKGVEYSSQLVLIKRSWPVSKQELYTIIASSKVLISFDPLAILKGLQHLLGLQSLNCVDTT